MRLENGIQANILLKADLNMTREVFENLVSNAVKYGRDGGRVTLGARRADRFVQMSVRNEGAGIPPDKLDTIFQKFTRLEESEAVQKQKGTGLGLFITKHIVESHGGRIEVESVPDQWTEFRFTLPCYREDKKT